jgi:3-hydroxyisobutyrate dehydrogenase-like beta-hydroxyacid dehydrogenase
MNQVSIIGCGYMGGALIQALANQGIQLHIWNRTPEKARALARSGVSVADSFGAALTASPMTIFCLSDPDYAVATALLQKEKERISGKIIVQLSSSEKIGNAKKLQEFVATLGGTYLDGAILATPALVGTHRAQIIYSGDASVFETIKSTLEIFGKTVFVGKELGMIGALELGLFMAISSMEVGLLQGRKYCQLADVPVELFDSLASPFITNHSEIILESMQQITNAKMLESGTLGGGTVSMTAGAIQLVLKRIGNFDIDPGMFRAIFKLYESGIANGRGEYDSFSVADLHTNSEDGSDKE